MARLANIERAADCGNQQCPDEIDTILVEGHAGKDRREQFVLMDPAIEFLRQAVQRIDAADPFVKRR